MTDPINGDPLSFNENWKDRPESNYLHWTREKPANQVQLAFRRHWLTFSDILQQNHIASNRCLEVGCGRGSLSAYFADNGWDSTLLDLSTTAIANAKKAFSANNLSASFVVGDCLNMPFKNQSFGCIFSIGLYEHFDNIVPVAEEQFRVLEPGGILFAYVVPRKVVNVQTEFDWINHILANEIESASSITDKAPVYRSDYDSSYYKEVFSGCGFKNVQSSGIYSMPMISNSVEFPFTLLKPESEALLVDRLESHLDRRLSAQGADPWLCEEDYGHAFLVWALK